MSDIPTPLITDILTLLPVKSLCRFRCISKPWLALINNPRFAKLHLSRTHKQRLILQKSDLLYFVQLESETKSYLGNSIPVKIELPAGMKFDFDYNVYPVIGSCNGLLCIRIEIASKKGFLLYNPISKECKTVPKEYKTIPDVDRHEIIGFGYAESIDDYKILQIPRTLERVCVAKVYSLKKDSWISIPSDFYFGFRGFNRRVVYSNGVIHFLFFYYEDLTVIAAFDLVEDKFKTLPLPNFMLNKVDNEILKYGTNLGHLSGCLCLSIWTDSTSIELWVMKEYGVTASWTKILRTESAPACQVIPLCYLNDDETMLVRKRNSLMLWDSKDEEFKDVKIGCIQGDWSIKSQYVESLVSPNRINGFTTEDDAELLRYWFN